MWEKKTGGAESGRQVTKWGQEGGRDGQMAGGNDPDRLIPDWGMASTRFRFTFRLRHMRDVRVRDEWASYRA